MDIILNMQEPASPFQGLLLSGFVTQGSRARFARSSTLGFAAPRLRRFMIFNRGLPTDLLRRAFSALLFGRMSNAFDFRP